MPPGPIPPGNMAYLAYDGLRVVDISNPEIAERLGISPRTLRYKIARMRDSGIQIPA